MVASLVNNDEPSAWTKSSLEIVLRLYATIGNQRSGVPHLARITARSRLGYTIPIYSRHYRNNVIAILTTARVDLTFVLCFHGAYKTILSTVGGGGGCGGVNGVGISKK